ncbi:MAG: LTA synthase family protein [Cellvibrionales bacterium]|tara:strand:+ start:1577 stop:3640 length:2064 start_codon:yes stop_codon:yes gene_type:complete
MQHAVTSIDSSFQKRRIYLRVVLHTLGLSIGCAVLFFLARLAALWVYGPLNGDVPTVDLWLALWLGLRFDVAVALRILLLGVLCSLAALALPGHRPSELAWAFSRLLGYLLICLTIILSATNFGYMGFFGGPLDSFVFEGMEYGFEAAYKSITGVHNVYPTLLATAALLAACFFVYNTFNQHIIERVSATALTTRGFIYLLIVSLLAIAVLARGTVSTFPLSYRHLAISAHSQINNLVPNGIIALYYGHRNFQKSQNQPVADDAVGRQLYTRFYGRKPTDSKLFEQFFTTTKRSPLLEKKPPHVVLNVLEGMGQALLLERFNPGNHLAGALQQHLAEDVYFKHFLPASNGTQQSLVSLLLNSRYSNISRSIHQRVELKTSAARIFKAAGYKTVFLFSGFEGLMNRASYFKAQGFDEFIGAHQLHRRYPDMQTSVWGGDDHYLFKIASELLNAHKSGEKPLFIATLTIVNHPPYKMPWLEQSTAFDGNFAASLLDRMDGLPLESLHTYRYTNDQLGQFISRIKASDLGHNTLIAATGDHAIRGMRYAPSEQLHQKSVPFYLYIPQPYAAGIHVDSHSISSHKDIMPTLYNLALSEARYPDLGRNLLQPTTPDSVHNFAYNDNYLVVANAAYGKLDTGTPHGSIINGNFDITDQTAQSTSARLRQAATYPQILDWLTRYQLNQPRQAEK